MAVGQDLLNVPFDDMVLQLALAIAGGQTALDKNAVEVAKFLATEKVELPKIDNPTETTKFPLIALGFFPKFYEFPETIIEVKIAITMVQTDEFKVGARAGFKWGLFSASVNASYSRKYEYKVEGSSLLRTRLIPAPPPAILQRYMEKLIEAMSKSEGVPTSPE